MVRYAAVLKRSLGVDVANLPGAGAGGGLGAGLVAFLGASIGSGFDIVAKATKFEERMQRCDTVITGEGSYDSQSSLGKVTGRVIASADANGKPWNVFSGRSEVTDGRVRTLTALEPDQTRAMEGAEALLADLAARWASEQP